MNPPMRSARAGPQIGDGVAARDGGREVDPPSGLAEVHGPRAGRERDCLPGVLGLHRDAVDRERARDIEAARAGRSTRRRADLDARGVVQLRDVGVDARSRGAGHLAYGVVAGLGGDVAGPGEDRTDAPGPDADAVDVEAAGDVDRPGALIAAGGAADGQAAGGLLAEAVGEGRGSDCGGRPAGLGALVTSGDVLGRIDPHRGHRPLPSRGSPGEGVETPDLLPGLNRRRKRSGPVEASRREETGIRRGGELEPKGRSVQPLDMQRRIGVGAQRRRDVEADRLAVGEDVGPVQEAEDMAGAAGGNAEIGARAGGRARARAAIDDRLDRAVVGLLGEGRIQLRRLHHLARLEWRVRLALGQGRGSAEAKRQRAGDDGEKSHRMSSERGPVALGAALADVGPAAVEGAGEVDGQGRSGFARHEGHGRGVVLRLDDADRRGGVGLGEGDRAGRIAANPNDPGDVGAGDARAGAAGRDGGRRARGPEVIGRRDGVGGVDRARAKVAGSRVGAAVSARTAYRDATGALWADRKAQGQGGRGIGRVVEIQRHAVVGGRLVLGRDVLDRRI